MSTKAPYKFEEFYQAFGRSVSADVIFEDGQVHIVQREKPTSLNDAISRKKPALPEPSSPVVVSDGPLKKHAKGRLLDSADRRRLPWAIRALLEIQEPDGSWDFSTAFEFVINGVAPPPMNGVSGKLWATAIAISIWRQFPEYFELLQSYYEKASLHADENILRIVRSVLQFDALDQIRAYKNDEARAIRERLEREAAAKRELEMQEEEKIARLRDEEIRVGKLSIVYARRLPMPTQQLFVAELGHEFEAVFSTLPPTIAKHEVSLSGSNATFKVGQLVESCRRRRATNSVINPSSRWHHCRITAIDEDCRLLQLDFLDGDCERERRVPVKFVRATADGAQEIRVARFAALKASWSQPILCDQEIARLEDARTTKLKPLPWDDRHHLQSLERDCFSKGEVQTAITPTSEEVLGPGSAASRRSSRRPRSSAQRPQSGDKAPDLQTDALFQAAAAVVVQYGRAYTQVCEAAHTGAKRYASAMLYRERFHAFDSLADALVALMERSVETLEAVWRWKRQAGARSFVWKGDDFELALVHSLDFLAACRELVEWYGEEFPLEANPFMLSVSLLDKAEARGLEPTVQSAAKPSALRTALRSQRESSRELPTWWPQTRYSSELRFRVEQAEQTLLKELQDSRYLTRRVDQSAHHAVGPRKAA